MPRTHPPYAPEYRRRMVELARAGRSLKRVGARVRALGQSDPQMGQSRQQLDEGQRSDGLTTQRAGRTQAA